ncbi:MAG: hypothetical protein BWY17_01779 [Deltaproteobacteria bacterium ADurb.Bin207]|jgi:hypothetical protein|nr:MAG: hypothetical protein BWY17_01779 [Deltaproteobacteria bacterium ADurb.Bin207]
MDHTLRKHVSMALGLVISFTAASAFAQDSDTPGIGLGGDAAVFMPIGNLGDGVGPMLGALLKLEVPVNPGLEVTGRAGYLYGLEKNDCCSMSDIPIWAGVRYFFDGSFENAYVGGELGLNMVTAKVEVMGVSASASDTDFGAGLSVGFKPGDLDVRGTFSMLDLGHAGDSMLVGASVGYTFTHF